MIYTLMLGAPVRSGDHKLGTLNRIIVNNGVANQFTVSPSGLFSGPDRVVPISDVVEATEDGVTLDISDVQWKAYTAFHVERLLASDQTTAPDGLPLGGAAETTFEARKPTTVDVTAEERSVADQSVVLTSKTRVGDHGTLAGLVADTGIPQHLLLDGGDAVAFKQVGVLDENHIILGDVPPRLDSPTPPGILGDTPQHLEDAAPNVEGSTQPGSRG